MESADNKQCNSTKKAEEDYMSCKFQLTSVDADEGQVSSSKPDILENSAKETKRKRSIKK